MSEYRYVISAQGSYGLDELTLIGAQPSIDEDQNLNFHTDGELVATFARGSWFYFVKDGHFIEDDK